MTREELLKGLTKEQREKVEKCKTTEEVLELAKEEGLELTDEQLEAVSGGCSAIVSECRFCHGKNVCLAPHRTGADCGKTFYYCRDCHEYFSYED